MKSRNPTRPRSKLSFAVDRSEIDISSDWVQSIMRPPRRDSLPPQQQPAQPAPPGQTATVAVVSSVAGNATVAKPATGKENATVELFGDTIAATVEPSATVAQSATVKHIAPVEHNATVVGPAPEPGRAIRLRPIRRITDGLTSGQFTVYRLMYDEGQACDSEQGSRIYRGGYADLCRLSGLSKRGVQNVVGELLDKGVVSIHQAPGYHKSQTTVYLAPSEESILRAWFRRGLCYAVGKGKRLVSTSAMVPQ